MKLKECSYCNEEFSGRLNQKFCSTRCKNNYHNERNRIENAIVLETNKLLMRNWNILKSLYHVYRSKPVAMEMLEANGFDINFHTHVMNSPRGDKYTMIYDFGYKPHYDNHVQIVQQD